MVHLQCETGSRHCKAGLGVVSLRSTRYCKYIYLLRMILLLNTLILNVLRFSKRFCFLRKIIDF
jgi:hypothetical protein